MNYQRLYTMLFNNITDALNEMEKQNYGMAKEILIHAQLKTERLYMEEDE